METSLCPRESGRYIADRAEHVTINDSAIDILAGVVSRSTYTMRPHQQRMNCVSPWYIQLNKDQLMNWIFMLDSINFDFHIVDSDIKYTVTYKEVKHSGYSGFVNALNRALDNGIPIYDPHCYANLTLEEMNDIFRCDPGKKELPFLQRRHEILKNVGRTLIEKYDGSFRNVFNSCMGSALKLVRIIAEDFEIFRDSATYGEQKVSFNSSAQMLVSEINLMLSIEQSIRFGKGAAEYKTGVYSSDTLSNSDLLLHDINKLTLFATSRVCQYLSKKKIINFSDSLSDKLKSNYLFDEESPEVIEMRGCAIEAVERLVKVAQDKFVARGYGSRLQAEANIDSVRVEMFFWNYRKGHQNEFYTEPFYQLNRNN